MALMELQPGAYSIKRHIPGQFMAIETLEEQSGPEEGADARDPESGGEADDGSDRSRNGTGESGDGVDASSGVAGEGSDHGSGQARRHRGGRTLEFACGNLFDVQDIGQVRQARELGARWTRWGRLGSLLG